MFEVYGIATRPPRIKDIKKESKTDVNENIKTEDLRMKLQDSSSRKRKFQEIKEEPKIIAGIQSTLLEESKYIAEMQFKVSGESKI